MSQTCKNNTSPQSAWINYENVQLSKEEIADMIHLPQKECSGCSTCAMLCPVQAIAMQEDKKGFLRPVIDSKKCTNCGLCQKHCPALGEKNSLRPPDYGVFAAVASDETIHKASQSGGVFYVLGRSMLELGGVVYGAALDSSFETRHIRAADISALHRLQGSKYVQSNMNDVFGQVGADLTCGTSVLFSGTPCQVSGLYAYLSGKHICTDTLLTASLVCYGVPSPGVFRQWLHCLQRAWGKLDSMQFRRTDKDWGKGQEIYRLANGQVKEGAYFTQLFFQNLIIRDSCTTCKYCSINRPGDITVGDFWGIENVAPWFMDDQGVSLVLVHTERGHAFFSLAQKHLKVLESSVNEATRQPRLQNIPVTHNPHCDAFWEQFHTVGMEQIALKRGFIQQTEVSWKRRLLRLLGLR